MKSILCAITILMLTDLVLSAEPNMIALATCNVSGKRYDAMSSVEELQRSPSWRKTEEYPPLSPRKAISVAILMAAKIGGGGRVTGVTLQEALPGKWIYIVGFVRGPDNGPVEFLNIVVLMNGHAVQPKLFTSMEK